MMSTPVMLVLSALMVTMVTCTGDEDEVAPNYRKGDMDGKWYIVGYATNEWTAYTATANRAVYVAQTNNGLSFTFSEPTDPTKCQNTTRDLTRKSRGDFEYVDNGVHYEVVVLNYTTSYAVIHTAQGDHVQDNHEEDHPCINELYSRTSTAAPDDVWTKFEKLSEHDDEIPKSNVHRLANNGQC